MLEEDCERIPRSLGGATLEEPGTVENERPRSLSGVKGNNMEDDSMVKEDHWVWSLSDEESFHDLTQGWCNVDVTTPKDKDGLGPTRRGCPDGGMHPPPQSLATDISPDNPVVEEEELTHSMPMSTDRQTGMPGLKQASLRSYYVRASVLYDKMVTKVPDTSSDEGRFSEDDKDDICHTPP